MTRYYVDQNGRFWKQSFPGSDSVYRIEPYLTHGEALQAATKRHGLKELS